MTSTNNFFDGGYREICVVKFVRADVLPDDITSMPHNPISAIVSNVIFMCLMSKCVRYINMYAFGSKPIAEHFPIAIQYAILMWLFKSPIIEQLPSFCYIFAQSLGHSRYV